MAYSNETNLVTGNTSGSGGYDFRVNDQISPDVFSGLSISSLLEKFIVNWIFVAIFIAGAVLLLDFYYSTKGVNISAWDETLITFGGLCLLISVAVFFAIPIVYFISKDDKTERTKEDYHWLHALSILNSAACFVWGVIILIQTFTSTFAVDNPGTALIAGYLLVLLSCLYNAFLSFRSFFGLIKKPDAKKPNPNEETDMEKFRKNFLTSSIGSSSLSSPGKSVLTSTFSPSAGVFSNLDLGGLANSLSPAGSGTSATAGISTTPLLPSSCQPNGYPYAGMPMMPMPYMVPCAQTAPCATSVTL